MIFRGCIYTVVVGKSNMLIQQCFYQGVPTPSVPNVKEGVMYVMDGLVIIIVAFAQTVSVAKLMGLKHNYKVYFTSYHKLHKSL